MFPLLETITGFAAIMLMLSLLVKTLTSVIKNQLDYYSDNLKHEVDRLVLATTDKSWDRLVTNNPRAPIWIKSIQWERLGEEFLTPAYMSWFLKQLDQNARVFDLESRLKIHVANVKYTFEMRMKNLSVAVGLGLCLLCNINAITIWKSLYSDEQLRATFSRQYAQRATDLAGERANAEKSTVSQGNPSAVQGTSEKPDNDEPLDSGVNDKKRAELNKQATAFRESLRSFLTDVSFGVGKIWHPSTQETKTQFELFMYEFMGSLLTGILVSIGAPYWHDLLQALSSLRPDKAKT
jgi:hypothetical protein